MYARLGFAVAAHVDPDILLVDEVLSVGDVAFQDRSIRKMLSFRDSGRAILFVSHNLSAVEMMCPRTIWLDHGVIRQVGNGLVLDRDPAAVGVIEQSQDIKQSTLAAAGWTDDRVHRAAFELERDSAQSMHPRIILT